MGFAREAQISIANTIVFAIRVGLDVHVMLQSKWFAMMIRTTIRTV
jgi:hypothetical protein